MSASGRSATYRQATQSGHSRYLLIQSLGSSAGRGVVLLILALTYDVSVGLCYSNGGQS